MQWSKAFNEICFNYRCLIEIAISSSFRWIVRTITHCQYIVVFFSFPQESHEIVWICVLVSRTGLPPCTAPRSWCREQTVAHLSLCTGLGRAPQILPGCNPGTGHELTRRSRTPPFRRSLSSAGRIFCFTHGFLALAFFWRSKPVRKRLPGISPRDRYRGRRPA